MVKLGSGSLSLSIISVNPSKTSGGNFVLFLFFWFFSISEKVTQQVPTTMGKGLTQDLHGKY